MTYDILFIVCYIVAAISLSLAAFYTFRTARHYSGKMRRSTGMTGMCLISAALCQILLAFIRVVEMVRT